MDPLSEAAHAVFLAYEPMFSLLPEEVSTIGIDVPFPKFTPAILVPLFEEAERTLQQPSAVISVEVPCVVAGDLHGNFHDLMRIFTSISDPFSQRFLFLGDYVDRGDYSVDVVTLLFALVVLYPDQFFLLRGNHEFSCVNGSYGLRTEIHERFGDDTLWTLINSIFQRLPLAAVVGEKTLCIHGGLGPGIQTLDDIRAIELPLAEFVDLNVQALVWSDPTDFVARFAPSPRGLGVVFGQLAISEFLAVNGLERMIRAHECVKAGVITCAGRKCITVFSSSSYANDNAAAFLLLHPGQNGAPTRIVHEVLSPQVFVRRSNARFAEPPERKKRTIPWMNAPVVRASTVRRGVRMQRSVAPLPFVPLVPTPGADKSPTRRRKGLIASASALLPSLDSSIRHPSEAV
jgi:protein phosphatase